MTDVAPLEALPGREGISAPECAPSQVQGRTKARAVAALLAGVGLLLSAAFAYFLIFSRSMSLDEGYLMVTIKGFIGGHALYDSVFTQYGPFYYCYEWLIHSPLSVPLTHDATRLLCIAHWLFAAGLLGFAAWRFSGSVLIGTLAGLQGVAHLARVANEPGHPQEIVAILLAGSLLAVTGKTRRSWIILGALAGALAVTKINVGAFFCFALLLAMLSYSDQRLRSGVFQGVMIAASVIIPCFLMRTHITAPWCRDFAIIACVCTVTALLVSQRFVTRNAMGKRECILVLASFAVISGLVLSIALFNGTSITGLIAGLLTTPLKMPGVALLKLDIGPFALFGAALSLATAIWVVTHRDQPRTASTVVALKALFAIVGAFFLVADAKLQFRFLLPWAWLLAVPTSASAPRDGFPRAFLCLGAAWQSLQVYPIAGTQATLATAFLVVAYALCLQDAITHLLAQPKYAAQWSAIAPASRKLIYGFSGVALLFLFGNVWCPILKVRAEHAALLPLNLPGSSLIRMDEETVTMYGGLTRYLSAECDTFITYPGVNSLFLWTGKQPPTQLNSSGWGQLTHAQQEQILSGVRQAARPRVVIVEDVLQSWQAPMYEPIRPLVRFVTDECRPLKRIGRFVVFELKPKAG